jgi:exopolysaccharide biosynthesis polyprenyl glycosylphosphotransferase
MRRRALVTADATALLVACAIAGVSASARHDIPFLSAIGLSLFFTVVTVLLWEGFAAVYGLYRREEERADLTTTDDVVPVLVITSLAMWAILAASTVTGTDIPASFLVKLWAASVVTLLTARAIARSVARRRPRFLENTLIVGAGDVGQLLGRKVTQHPELGLRLVGFVDHEPKAMRRDLTEVPVLGTADDIRDIVERHDVRRIIVAFSNENHRSQLELVDTVRDLDVQIDLVPRLFEAMGPTVGMHYVEGLPLVSLPTMRPSRLARATKRAIDLVGATVALVVLSPIFLFAAWRVKRDSDGPVFFRQERLGQDMKTFELLKFRTMRVDTDTEPHRAYVESIMDTSESPTENGVYKLDRVDDVTEVGSWLRKWSLDELPQLINVLRGEMSLVGPRPCLAYESELFEPHHFDRFLVPAGMTGLWQVTARARTTFKEALDLDVAYARNWSLGLDLKLLLRTPFVLFRQRGTA